MKRRGIRVIIATCLVSTAVACGSQNVPIHSVSLKVTSFGDDRPMAGVRVHRIIETEVYGFLRPLDPISTNYRVEEFTTDSEGRLEISPVVLKLGRHEHVALEWIFVNLDIRKDVAVEARMVERDPDLGTEHGRLARLFSVHDWENVDDFFNPMAEWRGFVAANAPSAWPSDADQGGTARAKFDVLWNSNSLLREREAIAVQLRPFGDDADRP